MIEYNELENLMEIWLFEANVILFYYNLVNLINYLVLVLFFYSIQLR